MRLEDPFEVLVWNSCTDDYPAWSQDAKIDRLNKVLQWHDYISQLESKGCVVNSWGSHQLLSKVEFTSTQGLLFAVYRVSSWHEFDILLSIDPLRDVSRYVTIPLTPLLEDRETDRERYEQHKKYFLQDGTDPIRKRVYEENRARYNSQPDYVGQYDYHRPANPANSHSDQSSQGDPLEILLMGSNPPEYISMWDDLQKLIHHEKVMWWHDYTSMLIKEGKISHCWGTNDFCHIASDSYRAASALTIFTVANFEEFDHLYKMDPIRQSTVFWSVLLQPLGDQRVLDELRLRHALGEKITIDEVVANSPRPIAAE